jgi:hypothetical protein
MATLTKRLLSGSTNGKPIKVTGTGTGATVTIDTAIAGTSAIDFVTLYADNDSTTLDVVLTLEIGGTTDPDNLLKVFIPKRNVDGDGRRCILKNQPMQNGNTIKAFAGTANVIKITGSVTNYV